MKMNSDYFVALAKTFEKHYGVEFQGIRNGAVTDDARAADPVQDQHGHRDVGARQERPGRLAGGPAGGDRRHGQGRRDAAHRRQDTIRSSMSGCASPNLPDEPQKVTVTNPISGAEKEVTIALFRKPGEVAGARRGISEIIKWMNYVTGNRFLTIAADLSESDQPRARQHVGPLRSGNESAGHAAQGGDPGSRQRLDGHRPGRPERLGRSRTSSRACGR